MRRAQTGLLSGAVAVSLLAGAAQAGLAVPAEQVIRGIAAAPALDYAGLDGSVAPLSDAFVAQVLGLDPPQVAHAEILPAPSAESGPAPEAAPQPVVTAQGPSHAAVTHEATNDDIANAYLVSSVPFSARTDGSRATREAGEPENCAPTGPTLWYRYDAPLPVGLSASTVGSSGVVALAVFVGEGLDELQHVGCHIDVDGEAQVSFLAEAGATYLFQVTLAAGGGQVGFNLDPLGTTTRISEANSRSPGISADGRYVAFVSYVPHVRGDRNREADVFLHDRTTGAIELISVSSDGTQGDGYSGNGDLAISDDGRFVAFFSAATNLVPGDTNRWSDVFVRDRVTGRTERVSVSSSGAEGRAPSDPVWGPLEDQGPVSRGLSMSADGRFVAFEADLVGLVPGDVELEAEARGVDVFVHDRVTRRTEMVSVSSDGTYADDWSDYPSMSADGRYVAFRSYATNLTDDRMRRRVGVYGWQRGSSHVYLHDRMTGQTELVSRAPSGEPGNDESWLPSISADGRYVAFPSWGSNFVADDDNSSLDVFVLDRHAGSFDLVSISTSGEDQTAQRAGLGLHIRAGISGDGRYVVFDSEDPRLEPGDTNGVMDVFVHDRAEGRTFRVSKSSAGAEGDDVSTYPVISRDGRHVAFESSAENLEGGSSSAFDYPWCCDRVFVHTLAGRP